MKTTMVTLSLMTKRRRTLTMTMMAFMTMLMRMTTMMGSLTMVGII